MFEAFCHPTTRENAISKLIESVALEEVALADLMTAEQEKIHKVVECSACNHEIIEVNDSVNTTMRNIIRLQILLQLKLEEAAKLEEEEE